MTKLAGVAAGMFVAGMKATGPAGFMLADPDGNPILVGQHAPASLERKKQN